VNENRDAALAESNQFLDTYYMMEYAPERAASWTATGSPAECIEHLRAYERMGFHAVTLCCTSWDQMGQLKRVIDEVLPAFV
jgi:alkanesulfonate monooxygenase SsuD/methylene tetrahydromethanopterin reductase-like flavin-dependent oxidoreductase (luciferase family)